jgi:hypothetical protein
MRTHDGRDHIRLTFAVNGVSSACQFRGSSRREEALFARSASSAASRACAN